VNEDGRFFPVVMYEHDRLNSGKSDGTFLDHFYFMDKGCCVKVY